MQATGAAWPQYAGAVPSWDNQDLRPMLSRVATAPVAPDIGWLELVSAAQAC